MQQTQNNLELQLLFINVFYCYLRLKGVKYNTNQNIQTNYIDIKYIEYVTVFQYNEFTITRSLLYV